MKRVFISYSADSTKHRLRVAALANQLRRAGVDTVMDLPMDDAVRGIDEVDVVLAVCTDRYRKLFEGDAPDAAPDAAPIRVVAMGDLARVIPVLLQDGASHYVPLALRSVTALYVPEDLSRLLRALGAPGELPAQDGSPTTPRSPVGKGSAVRRPVDDRSIGGTSRVRSGDIIQAGPDGVDTLPSARRDISVLDDGSGLLSFAWPTTRARRIANLPRGETDDFVGRRSELSAIRSALEEPGTSVAVLGPAGIGKTALALSYAFREDCDVIWLVRSASESMIRFGLAQLARELELVDPRIVDDEAAVLAVRSWLASNDQWLLIFDDAPDPALVRPFVANPSLGHVLVTSRAYEWRDADKRITLGGLAREDAIQLVRRRAAALDGRIAEQLAARFEGHPLMLRLASAALRDGGELLSSHNLAVLWRSLDVTSRQDDRMQAVLALAVDEVRRHNPAMGDLLELVAYLAPHDIPIRLLRDHVDELPPRLAEIARNDDALVRLLDELAKLGLITRGDGAIAVQAAVQDAARGTAVSATAVRLVDAAFDWDVDRPETWATAEALLPHALAAVADPHAESAQPLALQHLLASIAACLWKRGEPGAAIEHQRRAVGLVGATDGGAVLGRAEDHAAEYAALGAMLREVGELDEAADYLRRAHEALGVASEARELIPILRERARVEVTRGAVDAARGHLEQALRIDDRSPDADRLSIAITLSELSAIDVAVGQLDSAEATLERALAMQREALGTDEHPVVAVTLKRSADVLVRVGRLAEARVRLERALELFRAVFRTDQHVAVVDVMNDLANVLTRLGDTRGAQRLLEQTLDLHRRLFGADANLNGAVIAYNLARALILDGDAAGARRHVESALAGLETQGMTSHATAAALVELLGELDMMANDLVAAQARFARALQIRRSLAGPTSPEVMQTAANLAQVVARLGDIAEATALLQPLLDGAPAALDVYLRAGDWETLLLVADALRSLGRAVEARALLEALLGRLSGADPLASARCALTLARTQLQLDELAAARDTARTAHDAFVAILGRGSRGDATSALLRAVIEWRDGRPAAAFGLAARAARAFRAHEAIASVADALDLAGRAAIALGRPVIAATLLLQSLECRASLSPDAGDSPATRDAPATRDVPALRDALATRDMAEGRAFPATQDALFDVIESLGAADHPAFDRARAVALLARLAPAWLADRIVASAAVESAAIIDQLSICVTLAGAATGAAIAPRDGYGWRVELAPIRADGGLSEVRHVPVEATCRGPGRLVLTARTADLPWATYLLTVRFVDSPRDAWRADLTVSNIEPGNPFLAGPPVRGDRFFGRARLLEDVRRLVDQASLVLLGPRRSGKTSVLYRLAELCASSWKVITVDLHGFAGLDDDALMRELAREVAHGLGVAAPTDDRPFATLRRVLATPAAPRILLLLDEMAILAGCPNTALQLRAMSKWNAPIARIVMAGSYRDLDRLTPPTKYGSAALNELVNRDLGRLTHHEARSLLEQPVLGQYRYDPAALDQLLDLGGGRPFFLNALAYLALEVLRSEGGRTISVAHVDAVRREAASYLAGRYDELVRELEPVGRAALPALVEVGGALADPHARTLYSAGIAIGSGGATRLDPIFVDWWRSRGGGG